MEDVITIPVIENLFYFLFDFDLFWLETFDRSFCLDSNSSLDLSIRLLHISLTASLRRE